MAMQALNDQFVIVENAGYIGEQILINRIFPRASEAWKWVKQIYEEDEIDQLHIEVARLIDGDIDNLTYEY
ncbi:MAG TPA: hypothetical protein V6C97_27345 [Oculatellaceae cyanobacterium]